RNHAEPLLRGVAAGKLTGPEKIAGRQVLAVDSKLFLCLESTELIVANDKKLLEKMAPLAAGKGGPSMSDDKSLKAVRDADPGAFITGCLSHERLLSSSGRKRLLPEKSDNLINTLFFQDLAELAATGEAVGLSFSASAEKFTAALRIPGPPDRLPAAFRGFFLDPARAALPVSVKPKGHLGSISLHRDFVDLYRQRENLMVDRVLPEFDKFETGIGNLMPGKSFSMDVLPLLGDHLWITFARQDYAGLDGKPTLRLPAFAFVIELAKPQEASDLLSLFVQTLVPIMNFSAKESGNRPQVLVAEVHDGVSMWSSRYLERPKGNDLPPIFNLRFASATVGKHFIFASAPGLCKDLITGLKTPPTEAQRGRNAALEFSPAEIAAALDDNREPLMAAQLRSGKAAPQSKGELDLLGAALRATKKVELFNHVDKNGAEMRLEVRWK
ncbi:MAG TPA: hypothetical protein VNC50_21280, partial [Planctomycetia bacterium]|nr:hypothetical protein [Planctomycetia bacterium]